MASAPNPFHPASLCDTQVIVGPQQVWVWPSMMLDKNEIGSEASANRVLISCSTGGRARRQATGLHDSPRFLMARCAPAGHSLRLPQSPTQAPAWAMGHLGG